MENKNTVSSKVTCDFCYSNLITICKELTIVGSNIWFEFVCINCGSKHTPLVTKEALQDFAFGSK